MALQSLPGLRTQIGPNQLLFPSLGMNTVGMNGTAMSVTFIGRIVTSDGGSHTLDTTGSSAIGWRSGSVTFANAGSTFKVGIAAPDTSNGQPGRAVNSSGIVTFDVAAVFTGGGGGISANAWQSSVPTTGSKTIANGDLVAFVAQMVVRAGSDSVEIQYPTMNSSNVMRPDVTNQLSTTLYGGHADQVPDIFITFADGATGWIEGGDVASALSLRSFNSGSAAKEYGQLFQMPFPMKICGIYGWAGIVNAAIPAVTLYSDPLGTPVAQKSATISGRTLNQNSGFFYELFLSPYTTTANQPVAAIFTPDGTSISTYYKTLANAAHRIADPWGTNGYGVSRASGAFANANSSLDHYYIGLLVSGYDDAVSGGGGGSPVYGVIGG